MRFSTIQHNRPSLFVSIWIHLAVDVLHNFWLTNHRKSMLVDDNTARMSSITDHFFNVAEIFFDMASSYHWDTTHLTQLAESLGIVRHGF